MEQNEGLARLEQFVEKLIESHDQLKKEKNEVLAQVQEKQQEITELQEKIKSLEEDRSTIHNRVVGLIDRIDEWEKLVEREEGGQNSDSGGRTSREPSKKSSPLFNVKPGQPSKTATR